MRRTGKPATDADTERVPRALSPSSEGYRASGRIERMARAVAMAGGMLLVGVMAMTVFSVCGRYFFNAPIPGDYELTEIACGIAVFAFFPWCHVRNGNIVVGFFTSTMRPRHRAALDAVHGVVFTAVAGLITWRLFVGGVHKYLDGETTLFLGIPLHWGYFSALLGAGMLTAVCALVVHRHLRACGR